MTLLDIERDICRRLDKNPTNLDPETKARLDTFINDRYLELMRLDGINLRDEGLRIITDSGRARYALPNVARQINGITDVTSHVRLQQRTVAWMREHDPSVLGLATQSAGLPQGTTGNPLYYAVLNESGIAQQITNPIVDNVRAVSSHPDDVMKITVEGQNTYSDYATYTAQLQGTTPVQVPYQQGQLYRFYIDAPAKGAIILSQVTPPLTLAVLSPETGLSPSGAPLAPHQWVIWLWPTPAAAYTLVIDMMRILPILDEPTDEPALPSEFHTLLVWGGCAEECLKMDDNRREIYENKYQTDVRRLRAFLHQSRGERWIPGRRSRGYSDLGGSYPSG